MIENIGHKIWGLVCHLIPLTTALVYILITTLTWPIPYWGTIAPSFGLAAIFYWSVYRPDLFRPMAVFALGIISDIVNFMPIGLSACVFLSIHQLSYSNRRFFVGQVFFMLWSGFAVATLIAMIITWTVMSFYNGKIVPIAPVIIQSMVTMAVFPLPAWILIQLHKLCLSRDSS